MVEYEWELETHLQNEHPELGRGPVVHVGEGYGGHGHLLLELDARRVFGLLQAGFRGLGFGRAAAWKRWERVQGDAASSAACRCVYSLPTLISTTLRYTPPAIYTPVGPARFAPDQSVPLDIPTLRYTYPQYTHRGTRPRCVFYG